MVKDILPFYIARLSFMINLPLAFDILPFCMTRLFKDITIVLVWFAGCRDEGGNGGCTSEKRKRLSCADTDGGGRTKLRAVARNFDMCRRRALAAAGK
jgi:hypothetical protein